jgi:hypothetical protein
LSKEHFSHFALVGFTHGSKHLFKVHLASAPKQDAHPEERPSSLTRHLSTQESTEDEDKHLDPQSLNAALVWSWLLMIAASASLVHWLEAPTELIGIPVQD